MTKSVLSASSFSTSLRMKSALITGKFAYMPLGEIVAIDCRDDESFQDTGDESKETSGAMPKLFGSNKWRPATGGSVV
jgi:hypothetical protein